MIIQSLKLKNFKNYSDKDVTFKKGLNVVYGENERGKSTIIDSIFTVLFTATKEGVNKSFEQRLSWNKDISPELTITFLYKNDIYILDKLFSTATEGLTKKDVNKKITNPKNIALTISKFLGLENEEIYEETGVFRNLDLEASGIGSKKLSTILQSISIGADSDTDVDSILKNIGKEISDLKLGLDRATKNPGVIKSLQVRLAEEQSEYVKLKGEWDKLQVSIKSKDSNTEKLASIKEKIADIKDHIDKATQYEKAEVEMITLSNEITDIENRLGEIANLKVKIKELSERLETYKISASDLEELSKSVHDLSAEISSNEAEIARIKALITSKEVAIGEGKPKSNINPLVIASLIFVLGVGIYFLLFPNIVVLLFSAVISIVTYLLLNQSPSNTNELKNRSDEIAKLRADEQNKEKEKIDLKETIGKALSEFECKTESEFFEKKAKFISDSELMREMSEIYDTQLSKGGEEVLIQKQKELILKKKELEVAVIEKLKDYKVNKDNLVLKKRELQKLEDEEYLIREKQIASKTRVGDAVVDIDMIISKEEMIETYKKQLDRANSKLKVLELLDQTLRQALKNTAIGVSEFIRLDVEKYLSVLTNGKYSKIKITDDFTPLVYIKEKDEYLDPVGLLSKGTINQIFFLCRLAYFKSIVGDSRPPIIIDDALVSFDKERLKNMKKILEELSEEFQVILFTCHDDYKTWGFYQEL